jgi:hypothetical protein
MDLIRQKRPDRGVDSGAWRAFKFAESRFIFRQYCLILGQNLSFVNHGVSTARNRMKINPGTLAKFHIMACELLF